MVSKACLNIFIFSTTFNLFANKTDENPDSKAALSSQEVRLPASPLGSQISPGSTSESGFLVDLGVQSSSGGQRVPEDLLASSPSLLVEQTQRTPVGQRFAARGDYQAPDVAYRPVEPTTIAARTARPLGIGSRAQAARPGSPSRGVAPVQAPSAEPVLVRTTSQRSFVASDDGEFSSFGSLASSRSIAARTTSPQTPRSPGGTSEKKRFISRAASAPSRRPASWPR